MKIYRLERSVKPGIWSQVDIGYEMQEVIDKQVEQQKLEPNAVFRIQLIESDLKKDWTKRKNTCC